MVKNVLCNVGDVGSVPGRGAKSPHAAEQQSLHLATAQPLHHNQRARALQQRRSTTKNKDK